MTAQTQTSFTNTTKTDGQSCNAIRGKLQGVVNRVRVAVLLMLTVLLCACATGIDKDGVPKVDLHGTIVESTDAKELAYFKNYGGSKPARRLVTVGTEQMRLIDFVRTYCQGKDTNETCSKAKIIQALDASSGPRKDLPKGL